MESPASSFPCEFDLTPADPLLGPLADHGGPTQTQALGAFSPAIDQVPLTSCLSTDQRGFPRPDEIGESACDVGAYESTGVPACAGLPIINQLAVSSDTTGTRGDEGTWSFTVSVKNCTGGPLTGLKMQGGAAGWLTSAEVSATPNGLWVTTSTKRHNTTITGSLASFPDGSTATITVTVSGTVSRHAACGSPVPISGSWSASARGSPFDGEVGLRRPGDDHGDLPVTLTCG